MPVDLWNLKIQLSNNGLRKALFNKSEMRSEMAVSEQLDIASKVKAIIIDVLSLPMVPNDLNDSTNLFEIGADSMSAVEILLALEERLHIHMGDDELNASILESVGSIVAFVSKKMGG